MMRRILRTLFAAVPLAAAGGCSPWDVPDAAASTTDADSAIYRPEIQPLGWSADGERLLFVHSELNGGYDHAQFRCGGSGVYETDGTSPPRPVSTGEAWCQGAAGWLMGFSLSADGRTVYALPRHGYAEDCQSIAAFDLAAGAWREASRICGSYLTEPAISPDGRRIAVSLGCATTGGGGRRPRGCVDTDGDRFTVMNVDGSQRRVIGEPGDQSPVWSPDGQALAVWRAGESGGDRIVIIDLRTGRRQALTDGSSPAWSPDGRWLAFTRHPRGDGEARRVSLHVIRADGTGERTVYEQDRDDIRHGPQYPSPGGWPRDPLWSPDGRRIAFTKHFQSGNTLWVVNADGTGLRPLSGRIEPVD